MLPRGTQNAHKRDIDNIVLVFLDHATKTAIHRKSNHRSLVTMDVDLVDTVDVHIVSADAVPLVRKDLLPKVLGS